MFDWRIYKVVISLKIMWEVNYFNAPISYVEEAVSSFQVHPGIIHRPAHHTVALSCSSVHEISALPMSLPCSFLHYLLCLSVHYLRRRLLITSLLPLITSPSRSPGRSVTETLNSCRETLMWFNDSISTWSRQEMARLWRTHFTNNGAWYKRGW